jgi:MFS family permease
MDESALAMTMFGFGLGSMLGAFALPKLLERFSDRPVMFVGAGFMIGANLTLAAVMASVGLTWAILFAAWGLSGLGFAMVMTPSGRLLTRSSHAEDRAAIFAADFALSHACWLIAYRLAGALMTHVGALGALLGLSILGVIGVVIAPRVWPAHDPESIAHSHPELPVDHPHLKDHGAGDHPYIIDDLHPSWGR